MLDLGTQRGPCVLHDTRQRLDRLRLVDPFADEQRCDQVVDPKVRFGDQLAHRPRAAETARPLQRNGKVLHPAEPNGPPSGDDRAGRAPVPPRSCEPTDARPSTSSVRVVSVQAWFSHDEIDVAPGDADAAADGPQPRRVDRVVLGRPGRACRRAGPPSGAATSPCSVVHRTCSTSSHPTAAADHHGGADGDRRPDHPDLDRGRCDRRRGDPRRSTVRRLPDRRPPAGPAGPPPRHLRVHGREPRQQRDERPAAPRRPDQPRRRFDSTHRRSGSRPEPPASSDSRSTTRRGRSVATPARSTSRSRRSDRDCHRSSRRSRSSSRRRSPVRRSRRSLGVAALLGAAALGMVRPREADDRGHGGDEGRRTHRRADADRWWGRRRDHRATGRGRRRPRNSASRRSSASPSTPAIGATADIAATIPEGEQFDLTDVRIENTANDTGTATLLRNGEPLFVWSLANIRGQFFEPRITPIRLRRRRQPHVLRHV